MQALGSPPNTCVSFPQGRQPAGLVPGIIGDGDIHRLGLAWGTVQAAGVISGQFNDEFVPPQPGTSH